MNFSRTLHETGPELKRAISCDLDEFYEEEEIPTVRREIHFFGGGGGGVMKLKKPKRPQEMFLFDPDCKYLLWVIDKKMIEQSGEKR